MPTSPAYALRCSIAVSGLGLLSGLSLPAAEAARPPSLVDAAARAGTPVTLSPFEVTAQDDGSYLATNTLAGTRFNTELKDVPASISVMTADFLRDINASNMGEAMQYTVGAEYDQEAPTGNNLQSSDMQFRMRGFKNSVLGRNFFESNVSQDAYNIERATFSRGPNSVIFGSGGAGGIADATTKRAQQRDITRVASRISLFDDYRFELDVNRPITKSLAIRLNGLDWNRKGWRDFEFMDRRSAALALTWKPFQRTTIRFDGELGKVRELKPQPWTMLDSVTNWVNAGRPISNQFGAPVTGAGASANATTYFLTNSSELLSLRNSLATTAPRASAGLGMTALKNQAIAPFRQYVAGPGATTNSDFSNAGLFLEQEVWRNLFIEAAANQQKGHRDWNRPLLWNNIIAQADPNAFRPDGTRNPYVGQYYVEGSRPSINHQDQTWNDYRFTASYKLSLGRFGDHEIAGLVSRRDFFNRGNVREEAWANNPANRNLTAAANTLIRRTYVSYYGPNPLNLPSAFKDPFANPINVNGVTTQLYYTSKTNTLARSESEVAVLQSHFFNARLVTTAGLRHDTQTSWGNTLTRDPVTQEVLSATRSDTSVELSGDTRTLGAVLHVTSWLSLAANTSNNATPQNFLAFGLNAVENNTPLGVRQGNGRDFGVRFDLFNRRVNGAITYYETNEQNSQRFKQGNANSGWELWFKQGYTALGKPFFSITGEDTVDIVSHGWETEWTVNVNRNLRFVANASKATVIGSNQFPRVTAFAQALVPELRARPTTPITGVNGSATAAALANTMENQMRIDHLTEGRAVQNARPYGANLFVNYRFTEGRLKGLAASLGVNLRGRRVIGYNTTTGEPVMDGDYTQVNPSISYERALTVRGRKIGWNVTLAGTNVLGNRYGLLPIAGDEISVDRFAFETTPTVSLLNRFSF